MSAFNSRLWSTDCQLRSVDCSSAFGPATGPTPVSGDPHQEIHKVIGSSTSATTLLLRGEVKWEVANVTKSAALNKGPKHVSLVFVLCFLHSLK